MLGRKIGVYHTTMSWLCIIFFGLGAAVALYQLLSTRNALIVTRDGIHVSTLFKSYTYRWGEIERFGVAEWAQWHGPFKQRHRQVGINFKEGGRVRLISKLGTDLAAALVGFHGALPDNYGYKHEELADLLNGYLQADGSTAG